MIRNKTLAIALSAAMAATLATPVVAQPLRAAPGALAAAAAAPEAVQYRPRPGVRPGRPGMRPGVRPGRPGYHARWGRPYWRNNGWYYRNNNGAWVAAGIAGLAIGAAAAAAANNNASSDAVAYCAQRFRSYNPRTGTYTGYDGLQHPCP